MDTYNEGKDNSAAVEKRDVAPKSVVKCNARPKLIEAATKGFLGSADFDMRRQRRSSSSQTIIHGSVDSFRYHYVTKAQVLEQLHSLARNDAVNCPYQSLTSRHEGKTVWNWNVTALVLFAIAHLKHDVLPGQMGECAAKVVDDLTFQETVESRPALELKLIVWAPIRRTGRLNTESLDTFNQTTTSRVSVLGLKCNNEESASHGLVPLCESFADPSKWVMKIKEFSY